MSHERNRGALADAVAAWNKGDGMTYLALYAPSLRHHGLSPEPMDAAANRAFYEGLWAAFPGAQIELDETLAEGDRVAVRFRLVGEHRGDFMGVPATGRPFALSGQTVMHFQDGRVVERWTVGDMLGLLVQLGVVEPPGG